MTQAELNKTADKLRDTTLNVRELEHHLRATGYSRSQAKYIACRAGRPIVFEKSPGKPGWLSRIMAHVAR